jgi:uncharacterized protein (TIGR02246 family)
MTSTTMTPTAIGAELFQQLEQAWNDADGAAFGRPFADESDFVDIRGDHHAGDGAAIGHGHQAIFDTIYAGSTVAFRIERAREVGPDCIVAIVGATLDAPSGPLQGISHSHITAVIANQGNRWAITAFQNTLVRS